MKFYGEIAAHYFRFLPGDVTNSGFELDGYYIKVIAIGTHEANVDFENWFETHMSNPITRNHFFESRIDNPWDSSTKKQYCVI